MQAESPTQPDRLFFCHIPKTAGFTLRLLLSDHFHHRDIFPYGEWEDVPPDMSEHQILSYRLYQGHFLWTFTRRLLGSLPTITMLRNPIDRALSAYHHIQNEPTHPRHELINGKNATLEDFLDKTLVDDYANTQVLFLSGEATTDVTVMSAASEDNVIEKRQGLSLSQAKDVLEQMTFFGITERFDESLHLLFHSFGWAPQFTYERENVSSGWQRAEEYPQRLLDRLAESNRLDLELYEYGKKLFTARYQQHIQKLHWDSYVPRVQVRSRPTEFNLSFDEPIEGYGWYPREFEDNGRCFRWTGPATRAALFIRVAPAPQMMFTAGLCRMIDADMLDTFQITINGTALTVKRRFDSEQKLTILWATFEGKLVEADVSVIEFCVPRTVSPQEFDSANRDPRKLGMALCWLTIRPAQEEERDLEHKADGLSVSLGTPDKGNRAQSALPSATDNS